MVGEMSQSFRVDQGIRQEGIISMDFYKVHLNPLLYRIQYSGHGVRIGNITCKLIGCADYLAVSTNDRREGQSNKVAKIRNRYNQVPHLTQNKT